jgi:formate dehydrogenase subunit gamma
MLHGGPVFAVLAKIHLWTAIVVTPVILGHLLIAVGVLPGYRGVWRAMFRGGRVPEETARRVWPGWAERTRSAAPADDDDAEPARTSA